MAEPLDLKGTRRIGDRLFARVSHVSGYRVGDHKAQENKALVTWRENFIKNNPELPEDFHSLRGTMLHSACEHRLIQGKDPQELHPWIEPYYRAAQPILREYGKVYWCEKPVDNNLPWPSDLGFTTEDGEHRWHIWSHHGYCGTPDGVARRRGKVTLFDWKTSNTLYQPAFKPWFKQSKKHSEEENARRRKLVNGYYKYQRTARQLAAYMVGIEERLGLDYWIDEAVINVICGHTEGDSPFPVKTEIQQLSIPRIELEQKYFPEFLKRLNDWKADVFSQQLAV